MNAGEWLQPCLAEWRYTIGGALSTAVHRCTEHAGDHSCPHLCECGAEIEVIARLERVE